MKHTLTTIAWMTVVLGCLAADNPQPPTLSPPTPTLSLTRNGKKVIATYSGTLQAAASITGPWTNVLNATNPYSFSASAPFAAFRTRTSDSVFASSTVVSLSLVAPFQENFELAHAGEPDGIFPPVREKPYFEGTLYMTGLEL